MIRLKTPLSEEDILKLKIGDRVLLSGIIYSARDTAHKRLVELIDKGEPTPIDLKGQVIYYVGPAPAKPGYPIGPAGPTTSVRMDPYTPKILSRGVKGLIGKGNRTQPVIDALKKWKAVYFVAIGGAAALISKRIKSAKVVAYEDLGTEAIREMEVEDFPLIVANDAHGGDLFQEGVGRFKVE
ncbi:Fe-S-containing hydro-lyase [candidate division WOR-3 bacterium]|uniref:Fe-S-containing hydro-lyase n=1 Tax=candidate division WOR-3 bacterium TaxID=2052148 RepID=A0A660SKB5_UNCW3|nr:MAG: Fe-S-containing hydro-lyase [candidate division WOR-3 bacterium]